MASNARSVHLYDKVFLVSLLDSFFLVEFCGSNEKKITNLLKIFTQVKMCFWRLLFHPYQHPWREALHLNESKLVCPSRPNIKTNTQYCLIKYPFRGAPAFEVSRTEWHKITSSRRTCTYMYTFVTESRVSLSPGGQIECSPNNLPSTPHLLRHSDKLCRWKNIFTGSKLILNLSDGIAFDFFLIIVTLSLFLSRESCFFFWHCWPSSYMCKLQHFYIQDNVQQYQGHLHGSRIV